MKCKLLLITCMACSIAVLGQTNNQWIHFDWHGETIFGKYYPKVAISIPLKIESLPYNFCAQFDLGATTTMLYENSFKPFAQKHPLVMQKLDTAITPCYINGRKSFFLKGLHIQLDKTAFANRNVTLYSNFGDDIPGDSINTASQKLVGTIAPDLFQNKILVIDFMHNRLATFDQLPKRYAKATFVNAVIRKGRIKIPISIGDSTAYVMFDTGSCIGDLLLDKETITRFTNPNEPGEEFMNGNNWGQTVTFYSKSLNDSVFLHHKNLHISKAIFSDLDVDVQFNQEEKIIGLIGPVLFSNNIVIIDYKKSRFGVL